MTKTKDSREIFCMDKDWKFHLGDIGINPGNTHGEVYGSCKAGGATGPAMSDWNDSEWETVDAPHDWVTRLDFDENARANHGYKHRGIGWYRKCFRLDKEDMGKQILLEFDGISTHSTIYFNGSVALRNFSGYNSFYIDVTDRCLFGESPNTIAIRIDAEAFEGWWYEGAGIYRHTYLTKKSALHIAKWGIWVNPQKTKNECWDTEIETTIENTFYDNKTFTLVSYIKDSNGIEIGRTQGEGICLGSEKTIVKQSINIENPLLWDIEAPNLYTLVSEVYIDGKRVDNDTTSFGYRTIKICPDTGFYLNDKHVKLLGTCNHQDHAGVGVALPDSIHEYRIRRLKEMGGNAYRCAHNMPAKELLEACDKLGMLVMDENRNFETSNDAVGQVENMVLRDRNHPSIIMYSIFNEEPLQGTPQGRAMARRLMHIIKRLDNTRPILGALNGGVMEEDGTANAMDICGINYQLGTFDEFHEKYPKQPIVASESASAFSTRGVYETDLEKHVFDSYDAHKAPWGATVRENWKAVNTRDFVMGTFIWTGFDYMGEPSPFVWPSVSTAFGIMDTCGFAKDAFYLYKAFWTKEPMMHILPHWNHKGSEGKSITVMAHTNCEEAELFLNGKSLGKKTVQLYEQVQWDVPYESGTLLMKGFINGEAVTQAAVETTSDAVSLKIEPDRAFLFGDGLDAIPVNVSAVDEKGRFVPIADNMVTFTVKGTGKLLGVGNGDPNSHEAYVSDKRSLFNGRCQAIIQSIEGEGEIIIIAEADGLNKAELRIPVEKKSPPIYVEGISMQFLSNWRMTNDLFMQKPDPNMEILDSDMNTWEPVAIGNGTQSKFDDKNGFYALYRTKFIISEKNKSKKHSLNFNGVLGNAQIYVNGQKLAEKVCGNIERVKVDLPANSFGEQTVTVILQCINNTAGICTAVWVIN